MSSSFETQLHEDVNQQPATGAEAIEWLRSPPSIEKRAETVLRLAKAIGVDEAKRVIDRMRRKEDAIYALFENDLLMPVARLFLDQFLGHWMSASEDWEALTLKYAESKGMTVEELSRPILHDQRLRRHSDPEDAELIPPENRYGAHLLDMEDLGGLDGNDELTNSFFQYDRYRIMEEDDDRDE